MSDFRFELNGEGARQLLKSSEMQSGLEEMASSASNRAGEGYGYKVTVGKKRAVALVKAETIKAGKDNLQNNTILRSLQG